MRPRTIIELLRARAEAAGDQLAIRFKVGPGWVAWTWEEYWTRARAAAAALHQRGVRPGDHVLLVMPEVRDAVTALFGVWTLGAVPTLLGIPHHLTDAAAYLGEVRALARRLDIRALILARALAVGTDHRTGPPRLVADELAEADPSGMLPDPAEARGPALIQLTSGSTGHPRGVVIPHERLMLHLECMSRALPSPADSVAVSWLPLHHDMGLLGGLLFPFYNDFVAHMLSPADFRARPLCWLEAMAHFRGTICAAPPSAYAACLPLARKAVEAGLDLSPWRCAMVGAEPIPARVLRNFAEAFAPTGFRPNAFFPVYGLAEATVAVTFPRPLAPTRLDRIDRALLGRTGRAVPCPEGPDSLELVGVGRPIPRTSLHVVDESGRQVPERTQGEILVRSATLMEGYYREPEATAAALAGGWLRTGDLGYVADGDLFITGRKKELIIKGGQNLVPAFLEEVAAAVEGVRPGGVAAVGVRCARRATELVYLVAETKLPAESHPRLRERLHRRLKDHGTPVDRVLIVPPRTLSRTTSGKLRRRAIAEALEAGQEPVRTPLRPLET